MVNISKKLMLKNKMAIIIILIINMIITTGCVSSESTAAADSDSDTIKIGIYEPFSGEDENEARQEIIGIELAHKLYPTVAGTKIELIYADNKSDTFTGTLAAQKLINKGAHLVLGSYGNIMSMTGAEYFQKAKIPAIAITCTNPLVTKDNPYYFRINTVDSFQAVMAAKYVFSELKPDKTVILKRTDDDYGAALAQQFSEKFLSLHEDDAPDVNVVKTIEYGEKSLDYTKQLEEINQTGANVVFMPCPPKEAIEIIKQSKQLGLDLMFVGTNLWHNEDFINEGGDSIEGVVFTDYFDADASNERAEEFLKAYSKEYGKELPSCNVALGFDAYMVALYALEKQAQEIGTLNSNNLNPVAIRDILSKIREFDGVTGSITFDEEGDPIKSVVLITVENGEFHHKYTVGPEWNKTT